MLAGAEQRIRITYYQQLELNDYRVTYVCPLSTVTHRDVNQRTTGRFALTMRVLSEVPIEEMDCPSHGDQFVIASHTPHFHEASFETVDGDLAFPSQTDPVFMRESHPGVARKIFSEDEEDTTHDRSDY